MHTCHYNSPVGTLRISGNGQALTRIDFAEDDGVIHPTNTPHYIAESIRQLDEYFAGTRQNFDLPLAFTLGTDFQQSVWRALATIPYAHTASYGEVARTVTRPKAVRAVGQANNRNPFCIVIPCHRVVGSTGALTGYAGGLWRKEWLLKHERGIAS